MSNDDSLSNGVTADAPRTWSKEEIERFIAGEDLKYQKITLPHGLSTPGADRREICDLAFESDLTGKTILDIGSYLGYFCFEALERGAAASLGLEVDPTKIRQARILAEIKQLPANFVQDDIETMQLADRYDIVLCLNVLHHLFDPVGVLHKLADATRHKLVLEVASLNPRDSRKLGIGAVTRRLIGKLPIIFVARGVPSAKAHSEVQKFFFTPTAVRRILASHRSLFARVDVYPSLHKQRFIAVATRRRIGTLVIVTGPTSSGKSTFLRRIADRQLPPTFADLLPVSSRDWPMIGASRLLEAAAEGKPMLPAHDLEGAILHYDFLRPLFSGSQDFARDQALDLIRCAGKVIAIVLKPDQERLLRQFKESELSDKPRSIMLTRLLDAVGIRKRKRRHEALFELYKKEDWLVDWYLRWDSFIRHAAPQAQVMVADEAKYYSWAPGS